MRRRGAHARGEPDEAPLHGRSPSLTVWAAWILLMAGANLPAPLYAVYAREYRFSSVVLTAIFAVYALVLVPTLMIFGELSDRLGRRAVLVAGLAVAGAALVVFALADGIALLFAARALQGLAVGMVSGAATAALVELEPSGDRRRAALLAGLAQVVGSSLGALVAGALAEWAPWPQRLCYVATLAATVLAAAAVVAFLPGRDHRTAERWRIQLPRVPREIRGAFARVSLTAAVVWAVLALYLSIVPSYSETLLRTRNLALVAAVSAVAFAASAAAQALSRRRSSGLATQPTGLALLALGLAALVLAAPLHSLAALLTGAVLAGAGHGLGFLNAQDELNRIAPAERRGEVTAAFITSIYGLVGVSVIATGLLDLRVSLTLSVGAVAVVLGALALVAALWHVRAAGGRET
jgi:MFS family permease